VLLLLLLLLLPLVCDPACWPPRSIMVLRHGYCRYRMGDILRCVGHYHNTPKVGACLNHSEMHCAATACL
jgi:hypothetical protein